MIITFYYNCHKSFLALYLKIAITHNFNNYALNIEQRKGSKMATGTVKWFNPTKGFGFIAPEGGDKDVFVHISAVQAAGMSSLEPDQKIQYELEDGKDGKVSAGNLKAV